jgi:hypothetical protein
MTALEYRDGLPEKNREGDPNPTAYLGGLRDNGVAALRDFVGAGGTLIACDGSAEYAIEALALPVENILSGVEASDFSCPGSLLQVIIDPEEPLGFGLPRELAVLFLNSRVFRGTSSEATTIARYPQTVTTLEWLDFRRREDSRRRRTDRRELRQGEGRSLWLPPLVSSAIARYVSHLLQCSPIAMG